MRDSWVRLVDNEVAIEAIDSSLLAAEPDVPWQDIAGMRDHLAHRYFDTDHAIVTATIERDIPRLLSAVRRLKRLIE
jgi:uncharacterized protein with HEPN domain